MKFKILLMNICFSISLASIGLLSAQQFQPNKVIIWGHKLHSHTHSYIHYGFYKAFKHLGYETLWLDNKDNVGNVDFSNSLLITEGQVDQKIPLRDDCHYVLHNCKLEKYQDLYQNGKCLILQVYTHDVLHRDVMKIEDYVYFQKSGKTLYMPWATDLLPHEIDAIKKTMPHKKDNKIYWIGTLSGSGQFSNGSELRSFADAGAKHNISFTHQASVSPEQNIEQIQRSVLTPAIQGQWQCEKGYIPCRIFKNISYGALGITNSETVYELFHRKIVYHEDPRHLFTLALERSKTITIEELFEVMDFVKENHTYLNRIEVILKGLNFAAIIST